MLKTIIQFFNKRSKTLEKDEFSPNELKVAYTILNYLNKHPSAKDTLHGITSWWILKDHIDQSVQRVSKALDFLVSQGFIIVKQYINQEKYYRINEEKFKEIRRTLREFVE